MNLDSPVSPEIRKFCALSINKEHLQILSRNYFLKKGKEKGKHIIPSGYVTDKDGICKAQKLINDEIIERDDLNCIEEGAGSRIVLHTTCAAKRDFRQFLVLSTDTDVVMYNLAYSHVYKTMNVDKIGVKFGIHEHQRHIPVHHLAESLGTEKSRALVKAHILTGYDVTSKIGSKSAAFKACPEKYSYDFGEEFHDYHFQMAGKYLVKVIEPNIAAKSFDDLRYVIYTTRKTTFSELPPTSSAIKGHLL